MTLKFPSDLDAQAAAQAEELYRDLRGVRKHVVAPKKQHHRTQPKARTKRTDFVPPPIAYVNSLGDYLTAAQVADLLDVSPGFIRKLAHSDDVEAPSYVAPYGKSKVFLFTSKDVDEIREHLKHRWGVLPA